MSEFKRSISVKDRCEELEKKFNFGEKALGSQQNNDNQQQQEVISNPEPKAKLRLEPKVEPRVQSNLSKNLGKIFAQPRQQQNRRPQVTFYEPQRAR